MIDGDQASSDRLLDARLQRFDRLLQHVLIEFIADLLDMARLIIAKQIAGAANVEIMRRELEPGAQRVERIAALSAAFRPAASSRDSAGKVKSA